MVSGTARVKVKTFFIPGDAIKPGGAPHRGACMASDRITVGGLSLRQGQQAVTGNFIPSR